MTIPIAAYQGSLHLNCRKMQFISYLSAINAPVELLFYNAMEKTDELFQQIVCEGKSRYQYNSSLLGKEDLELVGIQEKAILCKDIKQAERSIKDMIDRGKVVFIWLDQFYFAHRVYYLKNHFFHSFIISAYKQEERETFYYLHDFDPDFTGFVDENAMAKALEYSKYPIELVYLDYDPSALQFAQIQSLFQDRMDRNDDTFSLYEWIFAQVDEDMNDETLTKIDHALAMVTGSRYLLSKYLTQVKSGQAVIAQAEYIANFAQLIKNVFIKYTITRKINKEKLKKLILNLKMNEANLKNELQNRQHKILVPKRH
ncbi:MULTISPECIES: BtrH N-terminal domain-containing protein [unclassified Paenibacillus]|uniref:BtrH N-terminal domain-containing protein n=1 Tax=unclassified Paenibacillus TaxID=185978 RepID=UPI001C10E731|nr:MULTISPECIES: BtrH N-terminal domain-containing protein [unclassified Paenibacillus]MBU5440426.1 BtrH N-terminal domain-containing protein [Paenibacillus sp. MSJ-34]CAH0119653.1 Ribostamycin:4-(gamma-L-glutamylamino)-(S)-2-hydroxybutanoyl-[BtrI acyl-carrier protein] 4-(gamma-L-glutamylamino)-(S)-2-hydroxybutanoate transferase [Paenibacillus sp. CECT 9249]